MRVATIDIGTNTVLLLVAEPGAGAVARSGATPLVAVHERATVTRLGEGVDRTRRLLPAAVARTNSCLDAYAEAVRALGVDRVAIAGTSAMRDAEGGHEVCDHVRARFGVEARILSGDEEARLTFRGALGGLSLAADAALAVFDIGGGSTEIVLGALEKGVARTDYARSFDVGSVRLTERFVAADPPTPADLHETASFASSAFAPVPALGPSCVPVGIAGTMTTLASVALGLVPYDGTRLHGHTMLVAELRATVARLASLPLEQRRRVAGIEPKRADVIVAGGIIALALLDQWRADAVTISDRGVRWGLAEELLLGR